LIEIPLFPLNIVLFPGGPLPLRIFETRYVDMVRRCMRESAGFGVVLIREGAEVGPAQTYEVGTSATIEDFHQLPDGLLGLSCRGGRRFRILQRRRQADGLNIGGIEWLPEEPAAAVPPRHRRRAAQQRGVVPQLGEVYEGIVMNLEDAGWVGCRLAEILPMEPADKQQCLELADPVERLDMIAPLVEISREGDGPADPG
jgi:Lon protease-like protein